MHFNSCRGSRGRKKGLVRDEQQSAEQKGTGLADLIGLLDLVKHDEHIVKTRVQYLMSRDRRGLALYGYLSNDLQTRKGVKKT
jgi:hypothetical protein